MAGEEVRIDEGGDVEGAEGAEGVEVINILDNIANISVADVTDVPETLEIDADEVINELGVRNANLTIELAKKNALINALQLEVRRLRALKSQRQPKRG